MCYGITADFNWDLDSVANATITNNEITEAEDSGIYLGGVLNADAFRQRNL